MLVFPHNPSKPSQLGAAVHVRDSALQRPIGHAQPLLSAGSQAPHAPRNAPLVTHDWPLVLPAQSASVAHPTHESVTGSQTGVTLAGSQPGPVEQPAVSSCPTTGEGPCPGPP